VQKYLIQKLSQRCYGGTQGPASRNLAPREPGSSACC